jgi:triacylglycerol esterase/lipase EstA (alpha/beta hydrolase family)
VNYGVEYSDPVRFEQNPTTKAAVLYGSLPPGWKWSSKNPANFICHSQGGNTIRLLIEMLKGTHSDLHPAYFLSDNRQNWVKSMVTLGTPHKGTTITDVVQGLLPDDALDLITRLVVSVSFQTSRFYDLQLDHWGFARRGSETFLRKRSSEGIPSYSGGVQKY